MKIVNQKYNQLSSDELNKINGGSFTKYKVIEGTLIYMDVTCPDNTTIKMTYWQVQKYTWWGLYGTKVIEKHEEVDS